MSSEAIVLTLVAASGMVIFGVFVPWYWTIREHMRRNTMEKHLARNLREFRKAYEDDEV